MTVDWITEDALHGAPIVLGTFARSPMFELKADHPDESCEATDGKCLADAASWPVPRFGDDLSYGWPS